MLGPAFRDTFELTLGEVGLVLAASAAGMTLSLVPWGVVADRAGERFALGAGLLATAAGFTLAAFSAGFGLLLAAMFLIGVFSGSATSASGRAIMGWFGARERGLALGIRQMAIPIGGGLAAVALPPIVLASDLRVGLLSLAAVALLAALASIAFVRDPPLQPGERVAPRRPSPVRDGRIWRLGFGSGLLVVASASLIGFLVIFLHDVRGVSLATAGVVLAATQIGSAIGRIALGHASDRLGRRIPLLRGVGIVGAAAVAATALLVHAPGPLLYPVLLFAAIVMTSWNGLSFTAAAEMAGRARAGTAMGLQNTLVAALGAVTPPVFGALVDATSWTVGWLAIAAAPFAGWLLLRPLVPEERERATGRELDPAVGMEQAAPI